MSKNLTIFQRLSAVVGNKVNRQPIDTSKEANDGVILRTNNKEEYETAKLEYSQANFLSKQWRRAKVDLQNKEIISLNNVRLMYRECELMDEFPEIGAALDIVMEETCFTNSSGFLVNVTSKSERIKNILNDLFVNRLSINVMLPMVARATAKYGNNFMLLNIDNKDGVIGWSQLPVHEVERYENGTANPYVKDMVSAGIDLNTINDDRTNFVWVNSSSSTFVPYKNWQIAHFRLLYDGKYLPYGCLAGDTRVETEYGFKEIKDIKIGDKVWTFDIDKQEKVLGEVTMQMNKGIKPTFEVRTKHNYIVGTDDHKLLIYTDDNFIYKEIKDLKVGDLLIIDNEDNLNRLNQVFKTEKIIEINDSIKQETYDITINNKNENFYANGIVTHNCSYLNKARRHFRMLSMMEDMMLVYRLERSLERRIFKINVGALDEPDVEALVNTVANQFKRTPIIDPLTGQLDLKKNILNDTQDYFIPVRDPSEPSPIENLPSAQNITSMDDIKFIQNKVITALRIPRAFLNFDETAGEGKNLSQLDIRFMRTIARIQQSLLMELNKIAIIHLTVLGFHDDLNNFSLSMNLPSSQMEMLNIENISKKIQTAKDAVTDSGSGLPLMSMTRVWKEILGFSDKEIERNLLELRLERALYGELELTNQIIRRTGVFDKVDNIYGVLGSDYTYEGEEKQDDGMGGSLDFDDSDMSGSEDTMSMDDAIQDGLINKKPLITEHKKLYVEKLKNRLQEIYKKEENDKIITIPLLNENFIINDELNQIAKELKDIK